MAHVALRIGYLVHECVNLWLQFAPIMWLVSVSSLASRSWCMFVFTLMQSRTHVDTVLVILRGVANSRDICWSHTMKVLGSHVTFVRRNSTTKVTLRSIYFDIKMWSRMFAVNVQSVSVQHMNWHVISRCTLITNSFVVVYVVKTSNVNSVLKDTLRDALLSRDILLQESTWAVTECCCTSVYYSFYLNVSVWTIINVAEFHWRADIRPQPTQAN